MYKNWIPAWHGTKFEFLDTKVTTETFYCIVETESEQYRFIVLIQDDTDLNPDEPCYLAYIQDEFTETTFRLLFGMYKDEISKNDFIELVKKAIKEGKYE